MTTKEQKDQQIPPPTTMKQRQQVVLVAGATGYLGRHLVREYRNRGWKVIALVRKLQKPTLVFADEQVHQVVAQATDREGLFKALLPSGTADAEYTMKNVDLVVSALGITRQRDGLTYHDVDYQANKNLLDLAVQSKVPHFAYVHVLNGDKMSDMGVTAIQAKQDFCNELRDAAANQKILSTVICPSGFFSDMNDFLEMARQGRAYLFGNGQHTINPIHGADVAVATANAVEKRTGQLNVGGPDTFTHKQLAELAFECLSGKNDHQEQQEAKITFLPDGIRKFLIWILPWMTPLHVSGPTVFFLTAFGMDMVGETACGTHHLKDFFQETLRQQWEEQNDK